MPSHEAIGIFREYPLFDSLINRVANLLENFPVRRNEKVKPFVVSDPSQLGGLIAAQNRTFCSILSPYFMVHAAVHSTRVARK